MDTKVARWARLKRYPEETVHRIHEAEERCVSAGGIGEQFITVGCQLMNVEDDKLGPFWPPKMEESAKAAQNREFERLIYPIWKGHFTRYMHDKEPYKIRLIDWIHSADWDIWNLSFTFTAGIAPRSNPAIDKLKKKSQGKLL